MIPIEVNRSFTTRTQRSDRVLEVAEAFGLGLEDSEFVIYDNFSLELPDSGVVYITGQSGSGKSLLLSEIATQCRLMGHKVVDIEDMEYKDAPLVDQIGADTNEALKILAKAGLNDAYLFIRKPQELSDGQRYRLALAKLIESGKAIWVCDEFGAVLDRTTAKVVAFSMQKIAREQGALMVVATTHTDLLEELGPDIHVDKHFRERVKVTIDGKISE